MAFNVLLTEDAAADLEDLYTYLSNHDSPEKAEYVLDRIASKLGDLSEMPERGVYPKELSSLGINDFREIFFKPYRIIYKTASENVYIYLIVDGRRDMQTLLQRRVLGVKKSQRQI